MRSDVPGVKSIAVTVIIEVPSKDPRTGRLERLENSFRLAHRPHIMLQNQRQRTRSKSPGIGHEAKENKGCDSCDSSDLEMVPKKSGPC